MLFFHVQISIQFKTTQVEHGIGTIIACVAVAAVVGSIVSAIDTAVVWSHDTEVAIGHRGTFAVHRPGRVVGRREHLSVHSQVIPLHQVIRPCVWADM